ncbi:MAG: DUF2809 domain-containing protein [Candidatus Solibacter sp.]
MISRRSAALLVSLAVLAPLALYGKRYYHGPAEEWVHNSAGGVAYVVFWCLVAALCRPRWKPALIAAGVLAATCALEFLQLWHPPLLEWVRSFFLGRTVLGSSFDWSDFPYYFAGGVGGWAWLRVIPSSRRF